MNTLRRIPAVFLFEWRRALTVPRMAWMVVLAAFPPLMLLLIRLAEQKDLPPVVAAIMVYILSPCMACMMGVFLWATPALSSELEARSWTYLAIRPHGPLAVLLGKYLVAVTWALPVGLISSFVGTLLLVSDNPWSLIAAECGLATLSCIAYSAVFLLIGVIIPKRAMLAGIGYAIAGEVVMATIPAAANFLTVQYRLRCLLVRWTDMDVKFVGDNPVYLAYFGTENALWHVATLIAMTIGYLALAGLLLRYREFTSAAETEN